MAAVTSYGLISPTQVAPGAVTLSPDISELVAQNNSPPLPAYEKTGAVQSTVTSNVPISEITAAVTTYKAPSFLDDFYYRVHVVPSPLALGNLVSDQEVPVEVWNAWTDPNTLSDITFVDAVNITFDGPQPTPTVFAALESRTYTAGISAVGPAEINATITLVFSTESAVLPVTGSRAIIWPLQPNWRDAPVTERLEWLTATLTSYDGREQAMKLRELPRQYYGYKALAHSRDRQVVSTLTYAWQARVFAVPIWPDIGVITADVTSGDTYIPVATANKSYVDGGVAVLIGSTHNLVAVNIQTVDANGLTLVNPITTNWHAGSVIYPAKFMRMAERTVSKQLSPDVMEYQLQFRVVDPVVIAPVDSATLYRGYPVLEERPNRREEPDYEHVRKLHTLDNDIALPIIEDESELPVTVQSWLWTKQGRTDITALRAWLSARAGKFNATWVASGSHDLTVANTIASASSAIEVVDCGYRNFLIQVIGRQDIVITLRDGTKFYRRVTGAEAVTSSVERLFIDSPLGVEVLPADVESVSYLALCRLDTDAVELKWRSPNVVECAHTIRGIISDI